VPLVHLFPTFPAERILHEDEDVVVIDKPVDVSTHAPDAGRTDDAFSRLRLALAERDSVAIEQVYLGIHQRLDRDTSGVLLFTRRKSANAGVAAEFEGRHVKKTYLAVVSGWPKRLEKGVLRDELAPSEGGRMQVVKPAERATVSTPRAGNRPERADRHDRRGRVARAGSDDRRARPSPSKARPPYPTPRPKKGQLAVTRYRVLRRHGTRALLELCPETGRTQARRGPGRKPGIHPTMRSRRWPAP